MFSHISLWNSVIQAWASLRSVYDQTWSHILFKFQCVGWWGCCHKRLNPTERAVVCERRPHAVCGRTVTCNQASGKKESPHLRTSVCAGWGCRFVSHLVYRDAGGLITPTCSVFSEPKLLFCFGWHYFDLQLHHLCSALSYLLHLDQVSEVHHIQHDLFES